MDITTLAQTGDLSALGGLIIFCLSHRFEDQGIIVRKKFEWVLDFLKGSWVEAPDESPLLTFRRDVVRGRYRDREICCGYTRSRRHHRFQYYVAVRLRRRMTEARGHARRDHPLDGKELYVSTDWLYYEDAWEKYVDEASRQVEDPMVLFTGEYFPGLVERLHGLAGEIDEDPGRFGLMACRIPMHRPGFW